MTKAAAERRLLTPRRVILATIAVAAIGGIGVAMRPEPIVVETARADLAPLRVTVDAEGRTRVRDRYAIAAPVGGRLERLSLDEGDSVAAGAIVARIAPAPFDESQARQGRARLDAARALAREAETRVRLADAAARQAQRDADRARRLHDAGAIAPRALEEGELLAATRADELAAARAHAAVAAADEAQARAALLPTSRARAAAVPVRAPVTGRVLRLAERSERIVAAGETIVELGNTRALEVVVDVLSSDAPLVRQGMRVSLGGWGEDEQVVGRVRLVEPSATTRISALGVEEQRVDVIVDVAAPPASLGDGYRVDARIVVWESASVLTVPASALTREGEEWGVYVVRSGRALYRRVKLGRMGATSAQVVDGVTKGDVVIVLPSDKVHDGVRVAGAARSGR